MSMDTYVKGFVPPDEAWQKMKAVWDACEAVGIAAPREVEEFFGDEPPDPAGVEVDLPVREWADQGKLSRGSGYELDVSNIPAKVKTIRFWNAW